VDLLLTVEHPLQGLYFFKKKTELTDIYRALTMKHCLVIFFFGISSIFLIFNGVRRFGNQLFFFRRVQICLVELLEGRSVSHGHQSSYL
jgi:hypothetical protein